MPRQVRCAYGTDVMPSTLEKARKAAGSSSDGLSIDSPDYRLAAGGASAPRPAGQRC